MTTAPACTIGGRAIGEVGRGPVADWPGDLFERDPGIRRRCPGFSGPRRPDRAVRSGCAGTRANARGGQRPRPRRTPRPVSLGVGEHPLLSLPMCCGGASVLLRGVAAGRALHTTRVVRWTVRRPAHPQRWPDRWTRRAGARSAPPAEMSDIAGAGP